MFCMGLVNTYIDQIKMMNLCQILPILKIRLTTYEQTWVVVVVAPF